MENLSIGLNNKLKMLRGSKSQKKVAQEIGIPYANYNKYETTKTIPDLYTLIKIANYYETTLDYLADRISDDLGYITIKEKSIIEIFREMSESNQEAYYQEGKGILLAQNLK